MDKRKESPEGFMNIFRNALKLDFLRSGAFGTIVRFAIRNVFRNKKRSFLTAISIFFAAIIVTFLIGFVNGMLDNALKNYQDYLTGDLKVTTEGFVQFERFLPVDEFITGSDELSGKISKIKGVSSAEQRIRFGILMGSGENTEPAAGVGADLNSPRLGLSKKIVQGKLESQGLYLCEGLANKLNITNGSELLLAGKTSEGGLNGIKVTVKGILRFGIGMLDKRFFFLDLQNARKLLKLNGSTTEIYVYFTKNSDPAFVQKAIKKILPPGDIIRTPGEQIGSLYNFLASAKWIYYFIDLLIILLASFVVVNTMMMAVFERMREIGTLKAMGYTDRNLFINFILEGAFIGGIGGITGGVLGYIAVAYLSVTGIDFSSIKNIDMPVNMTIYPSVGIEVLVITILMAIVMSAIAAIIPAKRAEKLSPVEALRHM